MSDRLRWSVTLTAVGLVCAVLAYTLSGSWWWALAGLLAAGIVANSTASAGAGARRERRPR